MDCTNSLRFGFHRLTLTIVAGPSQNENELDQFVAIQGPVLTPGGIRR